MPGSADSEPFEAYRTALRNQFSTGEATEHSYRGALSSLVQELTGARAVNEPKRSACGAPDYVVGTGDGASRLTIGHMEAKDLGKPLDPEVGTEQLRRYRSALPNLVLTNYLDFIWFKGGLEVARAGFGSVSSTGDLTFNPEQFAAVVDLLTEFTSEAPARITSADHLASRLARLTRLLRSVIAASLAFGEASATTTGVLDLFRGTLLPDLTTEEFADYFAQTIAYGLFAARVNHAGDERFQRRLAQYSVPQENEFLFHLFSTIAGPSLDSEPFVGLVDDLADVLADSDIEVILSEFGTEKWRRDPIVHFYETFIAKYDPEERQQRGVFYTPPPVVDFITKVTDSILQSDFGLPDGLADSSKVDGVHRVQVLDPACGTGTFLYSVVKRIQDHLEANNNAGQWSAYAAEHLLPRLHGFELLVAPYVVAHLKLNLQMMATDRPETEQLRWRVDHLPDRWNVLLTNSLKESATAPAVPLGEYLAEETRRAAEVKGTLPILAVIGNPPYVRHSENAPTEQREVQRGHQYQRRAEGGGWEAAISRASRIVKQPTFIGLLLEDYHMLHGSRIREKNSKWLQDDYVKFIRYGQYQIAQTGQGILAYITNHKYLDNPTFRGMRHSLLKAFDDIYIVDLHGNLRSGEQAPPGSENENIFDAIMQGVAISFFIKYPDGDAESLAHVHHVDVWGTQTEKFDWLDSHNGFDDIWTEFVPSAPLHLFKPRDPARESAYAEAWPITSILDRYVSGFVTGRDRLTIHMSAKDADECLEALVSSRPDETIRRAWLTSGDDLRLSDARESLREMDDEARSRLVRPCTYRPFDDRYLLDAPQLLERRRGPGAMQDMRELPGNLALVSGRSNASGFPDHFFATRYVAEAKSAEASKQAVIFPIYIPRPAQGDLLAESAEDSDRSSAFNVAFVDKVRGATQLGWVPLGAGDLESTFGPEDLAGFIYGQWYSPVYREVYAKQICDEFPRVFIPPTREAFTRTARLGHRLLMLHTGDAEPSTVGAVTFPVTGDGTVDASGPEFVPLSELETDELREAESALLSAGVAAGRVYLGKRDLRDSVQYFTPIEEEVWDFTVGGYQPCELWLRHRRGRQLSFDEQQVYKRLVRNIGESLLLMEHLESVTVWLRPAAG